MTNQLDNLAERSAAVMASLHPQLHGWHRPEERQSRGDPSVVVLRSPWYLGRDNGTTTEDFAAATTAAFEAVDAELIEAPGDVTGGWLRARGRVGGAEIEVRSKGFTEIAVRMQRPPGEGGDRGAATT